MPAGTTLRFDGVPVEDFLLSLHQHEHNQAAGFLPGEAFLKEAKIEARKGSPSAEDPVVLTLYHLQEKDALSQKVERFVLLHTGQGALVFLRETSLRLKAYLAGYGVASLFRIDPRYGLVCGSAEETVDDGIKWDRPGLYTTLYLTDDASSPSLALLDYVPIGMQKRYRELFQRYNGIPPVQPGFLAAAWKKLRGGETEDAFAANALTYRDLKILTSFLKKTGMVNASISLIYKDLDQSSTRSVLLDESLGAFHPSGNDRFFTSLGELA